MKLFPIFIIANHLSARVLVSTTNRTIYCISPAGIDILDGIEIYILDGIHFTEKRNSVVGH